jgi:alpha-1,3-rhamnosyl/mannosyltransferase
MACGTPAVCSNASAIPEVAGQVCRLFDPYSVEDIAATITAALENDIDNPEKRQECLTHAANFTWEKCAHQTYKVYQAIARDH